MGRGKGGRVPVFPQAYGESQPPRTHQSLTAAEQITEYKGKEAETYRQESYHGYSTEPFYIPARMLEDTVTQDSFGWYYKGPPVETLITTVRPSDFPNTAPTVRDVHWERNWDDRAKERFIQTMHEQALETRDSEMMWVLNSQEFADKASLYKGKGLVGSFRPPKGKSFFVAKPGRSGQIGYENVILYPGKGWEMHFRDPVDMRHMEHEGPSRNEPENVAGMYSRSNEASVRPASVTVDVNASVPGIDPDVDDEIDRYGCDLSDDDEY